MLDHLHIEGVIPKLSESILRAGLLYFYKKKRKKKYYVVCTY